MSHDRATRTALGFFALTTLVFWLPTVRGAFDGSSYVWALFAFGGRGIHGDYWFPLLAACAALAVAAGAWRGRRWAFVLLVGWSLFLLVGALWIAVSSPEEFRLQGDTMGMDLSLAWFGPVLAGFGLVLSLIAASRAWRRRADPGPWNRRWLLVLAGTLPLQFLLLRLGDPGSTADQVGVLLTVAQWLLTGRIFRAARP